MGRQRDATIDEAIMRNGAALVREEGYAGFSVERLSARVGIPKSTVYRRWQTRDELLAEVLAGLLEQPAVRTDVESAPITQLPMQGWSEQNGTAVHDEPSPRAALIAAVLEELAFARLPEGRAAAITVLQALEVDSAETNSLVAKMRQRRDRLAALVDEAAPGGSESLASRRRAAELLFAAAWGGLLGDTGALDAQLPALIECVLRTCEVASG